MADDFKPILYLKDGCPFCTRVLIYSLESGALDDLEVKTFAAGSEEEAAIRGELDGKFDKVTFPAAQMSPGEYIKDTGVIIGRLADTTGKNPDDLPVTSFYTAGPFAAIGKLFRENMELKKQLEA